MPLPHELAAPDENRPKSDPEATLSDAHPDRRPPFNGVATVMSPAPLPSPPPPGSGSPGSSGALGLIQPGADLGPRYHVEAALGEGGMGSVYRAYDRELDRLVAIKVIRPGLVADPSAVQRFKQELLLGSKASHKNILRIHDLGDVEGLKFISMAYVDGEDLHHILRREGRLPIERAVKLARQMGEALAAAHAEGIVHRDLKPSNILIDRSGTAYVSDFGLAKSLESAAAAMTRSGELLGTPRYMAPEQVEGSSMDNRVDIYAFGLILYEMVTGTIPFHGDSAIQELLQRVRTSAPDPRTVNPEIPVGLAQLILRCLEKDPDARFQHADEIVAALGGPTTSSRVGSSQAVRVRTRSGVVGPKWRRKAFLLTTTAAILAALVGGAVVARYFVMRSSTTQPASVEPGPAAVTSSRRHVAVLPFRVLGSQDQLRYVAEGVVEALSSKLFQSDSIGVVSNRDVEALGHAESIQDAARTLGANLIVEGTVQAAGDQLRLVVNLHDMSAGRRTWSQQFTGVYADLFGLQDDIYEQLSNALGIAGSAEILPQSVVRPTQDIDAYDLYLKGRNALRARQDPVRLQAAVGFFEDAIKKDQAFALAYTGLADASLLVYQEKRDGFWAERARAAALRARDLDDKLPEVYFALGSVYSNTGKHAEAVVVLRRALELAPNSDEAYRRLGTAYQELGRKSESIDALGKAVEVNPYFWLNHNVLGGAYLHFGESEKALDAFKRVTELEPTNPIGFDNIGSAYFNQGRWEDCIPAYQQALKLQPHWLTYANLGTAYFYLRRYPDAVEVFERAVGLNPNDAITAGNLADALRWSGQRERAREVYARAIALAYKDLQVNPRDATTLAMMALYQGKSGNLARADEFIRKARAIDPRSPPLFYYEGVVHVLAGRDQRALEAIEKALAGGYAAREIAGDPELQTLAKSPAFERLLRRHSARSG